MLTLHLSLLPRGIQHRSFSSLAAFGTPWYGCQLRLFPRTRALLLSNTKIVACHGKTLSSCCILALLTLGLPRIASPQISSLPAPPPSQDTATVERPDFSVKVVRPNAPAPGEQDLAADRQTSDSGVRRLLGHVDIELFNGTFKADEAEFNEDTRIFTAHGHVYYRNYEQNEVVYCDSLIYNSETRHGIFIHARGYTKTKVVARPGILITQEPFYFEGAVVEKTDEKYVLYEGTITDCHVPKPWWVLRSRVIDIIPEDHAVTHNATFYLHGIPMFYFPVFYKELKKEPRRSGFLTPEAGHSSQFGYFFGTGYYWDINRSYDLTYLFTDYTSRGYAHHADFRGKPSQRSDFNLILYGVQDRGEVANGTVVKAPGVSVTGVAKTEFGDGWIARASIDYLSSFLFRQTFSASFNEAVYSSTNSVAYVSKHFDYYTFTTDVSRNQNFDSTSSRRFRHHPQAPGVRFPGTRPADRFRLAARVVLLRYQFRPLPSRGTENRTRVLRNEPVHAPRRSRNRPFRPPSTGTASAFCPPSRCMKRFTARVWSITPSPRRRSTAPRPK